MTMKVLKQEKLIRSIKRIKKMRDIRDQQDYAKRRHKFEVIMHILLGIHEMRHGAYITRLTGYVGVSYGLIKGLLDALYDLGYVTVIIKGTKRQKYLYEVSDKGYELLIRLETILEPLTEIITIAEES